MGWDEYLGTLTAQIRSRTAREEVRQEIRNHLEDQAEAYEAEGMTREEARSQAVLDMGDPVSVGIDLDRIHRPKMAWKAVAIIGLLSLAGLLIQYLCFWGIDGRGLSGETVRLMEPVISRGMFIRQCIYTAAGFGVMLLVCMADYSRLAHLARLMAALWLAGLVLLCMSRVIYRLNGSFSYMKALQYVFIPLYGGILYQYRGLGWQGIWVSLAWLGAAGSVGLFFLGGGISVTAVMLLVCYGMLLAVIGMGWMGIPKGKGLFVCGAVIPAVIVIVVLFNLKPYQWGRLQVIFFPETYGAEAGWIPLRVREMVSHLTLFGEELERLVSENRFPGSLPGAQYDYMLLQIASLYGLAAAGALVAAMAGLYAYLFYLVMRQKNQMGRLVGGGCVLLLAVELVQSVLINLGYFVIASGGLPFLASGGSHILAIYVLLGVLLSIYRYQNLVWERFSGRKAETGVIFRLGRYRVRIEKRPE